MKLVKFSFLCSLAILLFACGNPKNTEVTTTTESGETLTRVEGKHFGEIINEEGTIAYEALLSKLEASTEDKVPVKVKGNVESVCQAKGCWMNIVSNQEGVEQEMFVKFKDYGFFMPKDIAGKEVIMDGYAFKEVTSVDELRHYAEDEGKSEEEIAAITEPKEELKFMASGVILVQ